MAEMAKIENGVPEGNTVVPPKRIRGKYWFFTWNNYSRKNIGELVERFGKEKYVFQEEIGEEGTRHLQGVIILKREIDFNKLRKWREAIHWEKVRFLREAKEYVTKTETRNGEIFSNFYRPVYDIVSELGPLPWQKIIIDEINEDPDPRKIYWIWEEIGNRGKSALCKHLVLKYQAIIVGGRAKDAQFGIISKMKKDEEIRIVCFDIPRSQYNRVSYSAIESIKNGLFFSSKYESEMCVFNIPHVIVFCNYEPNREEMSDDRWEVINI